MPWFCPLQIQLFLDLISSLPRSSALSAMDSLVQKLQCFFSIFYSVFMPSHTPSSASDQVRAFSVKKKRRDRDLILSRSLKVKGRRMMEQVPEERGLHLCSRTCSKDLSFWHHLYLSLSAIPLASMTLSSCDYSQFAQSLYSSFSSYGCLINTKLLYIESDHWSVLCAYTESHCPGSQTKISHRDLLTEAIGTSACKENAPPLTHSLC